CGDPSSRPPRTRPNATGCSLRPGCRATTPRSTRSRRSGGTTTTPRAPRPGEVTAVSPEWRPIDGTTIAPPRHDPAPRYRPRHHAHRPTARPSVDLAPGTQRSIRILLAVYTVVCALLAHGYAVEPDIWLHSAWAGAFAVASACCAVLVAG